MKSKTNPDSSILEGELIEPQLNILLTTDDDDLRPVYISGNFNNWKTQDFEFEMEKIGNGLYHYKFAENFNFEGELLYKFTKGDWSEVEIDQYGNRTENRLCKSHSGVKKEHVFRWR